MKEEKIVKKGFIAEGTTCNSCAEIIKRQAHKVDGVKHVDFDYASETGHVTFDTCKTDMDTILSKIEEKGYKCFILADENRKGSASSTLHPDSGKDSSAFLKPLGWVFAVAGIIVVSYLLYNLLSGSGVPQITANMGYGLLFIVGLLTGFHCIAMCGGFVVSYTAKAAEEKTSTTKAHIMYGAGKLLSYTIIGAAFGLLGSIVAFTPMMRGVAGIIAGIFLLLFGLKMLNVFPSLRRLSIPEPKFISRFAHTKSSASRSPLIIGLLNGLMIACGPLQAIYIMAAGTGSMIEGAKILFIFGLGTLPVMLGFGYLTSIISSKATHKLLKASGIVVMILGIVMLNRGLALTGTGYDAGSIVSSLSSNVEKSSQGGNTLSAGTASSNVALLNEGYQEIRMDVTSSGYSPSKFVLKKGVPVKWIINGKEITGCNKAIQVPKLGLSFDIKSGEQTIQFTPTETGTIPWSCWMGMLRGTFIVKDDLDSASTNAAQQEIASAPSQPAGTCSMGGGGGGCGCGR